MKPLRLTIYHTILITLLLSLAACGVDNKKYVVGVSQCSEDNWREKMNSEMVSAALAEGDITLDIVSANDDSQLQDQQIDQFVDRGVSLIIVAPNQTKSISQSLKTAQEKGIPVVFIDRKAEGTDYTAFIGADNYEAGRALGDFLAKRLQGHGSIVEFQGLEHSSPANERHRGFADVMKDYPGIHIINGGHTDWTTEGAEKTVRTFLKTHPDILPDAIFGHNDRIALEARRQYAEQGHAITSVGVDALPTAEGGLRKVLEGELAASYLYPTRGDIVIGQVKKILGGDSFEKDTYLSSALITSDNADAVLTQIDDLQQMQQRVSTMSTQIDGFLSQINSQRMLLTLSIIIVLMAIFLMVYIYRMEAVKRQRAVAETNERLRFFTNVSHEFRTPLTLIADPIERVVRSGELSAENSRLLNLAKRQVDVMLGLVGQILDLRKLQNKKMKLNIQETDIVQTVTEWVEGFRPMAESHEVAVRLLAPTTLKAATDIGKLERIVYNLLSNAMKYAPRRSMVEVVLGATPDGDITLSVADQGKGMTRQEVARVFERFYQASAAASGTGIGLSLAKELSELMHGTISVESSPGKGTRFLVTLPTQTALAATPQKEMVTIALSQAADEKPAATVTNSNTPAADASQVLVVDDNADVRVYLRSLLHESGYNVMEAADGQEGLRMATDHVPDIIISDVMMPVIDGQELCQRLKEQTATSHIPVILLTAQAMEDQRADGYDRGADAYITKPFSSRVLLSRVQNLLSSRRLLKMVFSGAPADETASAKPAGKEPTAEAEQPAAHEETREDRFLAAFRGQVEEHIPDSDFTVEMLAANLNLSRVQMYRKIKALTGQNPVELIRLARLTRAEKLLQTKRYTVSEVAYEVGFSSPSYFTKCYKEKFGHTPGEK